MSLPRTSGAPTAPFLAPRLYDRLKFVAQVVLPGIATFYFTIATIWGIPNADKIVGTISAFDLLLGLLLGVSTLSYNRSGAKFDGVITVSQDENGLKHADMNLKNYADPADVVNQDEVVFKVEKGDIPPLA